MEPLPEVRRIADHLPPSLQGARLESALADVLQIAGLCGMEHGSDHLVSVTTLLVGLYAAKDPMSLWFQQFCVQRDVDRDRLLWPYQLKDQDLADLAARAPTANVDTAMEQKDWGPDAVQILRVAIKIARAVPRGTDKSQSVSVAAAPVGVRHVLAALAIEPPPDANQEMAAAGLEPRVFRRLLQSALSDREGESWRILGADPESMQYVDVGNLGAKQAVEPASAEMKFTAAEPVATVRSNGGPARYVSDTVDGDAEDHLDVEREAHAFARLAASVRTDPPLAIGVFGDWGSGKTFFMDKMRAHIEDLTRAAADAEHSVFHSRIVQIRFNAWHYMENNLWASLVDHIFREMDEWLQRNEEEKDDITALFERLSTARHLRIEAIEALVAARRRRRDAMAHLEQKRNDLAATEAQTESVSAKDVWAAIWETLEKTRPDDVAATRKRIEDRAAALGFPEARQSGRALLDALRASRDQSVRGKMLWRSITQRLGTRWGVAAVAALFVLPVGVDALLGQIEALEFGFVSRATAALTTAMTTVTGWIAAALKSGNSALLSLSQFQAAIDNRLEARDADKPDAILQAEQALEVAKHEVALAEQSLSAADQELTSVRSDFAGTAKERLGKFIREKVAKGDYARHLGLIATIRRDFEQLAELLAQIEKQEVAESEFARADESFHCRVEGLGLDKLVAEGLLLPEEVEAIGPENELPTGDEHYFRRIVLYIDDLDRCPTDRVVDVLQACHLLLSFRLFVVVVAVDSRWLSGSLLEHYKGRLAESTSQTPAPAGLDPIGPIASPRDYLEKIFQVPYWVRPIREDASRRLVSALVKAPPEEPDHDPEDIASAAAAATPEAAAPPHEPPPAGELPVPPSTPQSSGALTPAGASPGEAPAAPESAPGRPRPDAAPQTMLLLDKERDLLAKLAPHADNSPRALKRFVNVYRLVRTCLDSDTFQQLIEGDEPSPTCHALAANLAIVNGSPDIADEFFELCHALVNDHEKTHGIADLVDAADQKREVRWFRVARCLGPAAKAGAQPEKGMAILEALARLTSIARRYSFRNGR